MVNSCRLSIQIFLCMCVLFPRNDTPTRLHPRLFSDPVCAVCVRVQLKRGLVGFWVAHPALVRTGMALVHAFAQLSASASASASASEPLRALLDALIPGADAAAVWSFACGTTSDAPALQPAAGAPLYDRALVAATCRPSALVANHAPSEVRYNVFQALQYLAAYLAGRACVSLPTAPIQAGGGGGDVCLMALEDLATTERSRWEVWAELAHGRLSVADFLTCVHQEYRYIQVCAGVFSLFAVAVAAAAAAAAIVLDVDCPRVHVYLA